VVREDAHLLFGFNNKQERTLFRELIKTNGVGPKLALAILSGMNAQQFVNAVEREDPAALIKLPGIGKKTAERLIVEMKDRFKGLHGDLFTPAADLVLTSPPARIQMMRNKKRLPHWWRWAINLRKPAGW
jgi:Holliday junction DNA helicase RuvA